ncbi:hypothetical protein FH972_026580 [Carpinus fangiana]|uniref:Tetratricopeptide repeat domain-containing protein n=1 Tax=Carpinus fangiana TaxID=176857 RepID=A0A5N6L6Y0_9ROSI|nr:hypothetical protein FH972_026580 [Carpinus fangiana]
MVFKPINLARQSLLKSFAHGYAQSLVAASQSSSASQNTSFQSLGYGLFGRPQLPAKSQHHQHGFHSTNSAGAGAKAGQSDSPSGLAAYYDAWQRHQKAEDKDWHQFQFAKRIGWKAPTTIPEGQVAEDPSKKPRRAGLTRSYTTSALDDDAKQVSTSIATPANSHVAAADDLEINAVDTARFMVSTPNSDAAPESDASFTETSLSPRSTAPTSVISESDVYTEQLTGLAEAGKYGDIPGVFERMLVAGVAPTASAYNALMLSAMDLVQGKHQVVPKVLDVYTDMLHRGVVPDTSSYAIMIELLAARAVEVMYMKKDIATKQARYGGMDQEGSFLFRSDEAESNILAEDDSLSLAVKLFDTAAAVSTSHLFASETYRVLIGACAETGRTDDMVRIYANMESQNVQAPTAIFAPMIQAFASTGDLASAVECYDEYKALAVAHDIGEKVIVRKDEDVYAAVVKAYAMCNRTDGGLRFVERIEASLTNSDRVVSLRNTIALQSLLPQWLAQGKYADAIAHTTEKLTGQAQAQAFASICIHAADKGLAPVASQAFRLLDELSPASEGVAHAMLAMHVRLGNIQGANGVWQRIIAARPTADLIEPTAMYALSLIAGGNAEQGLKESRAIFGRVRSEAASKIDVAEQIDEAVEVISSSIVKAGAQASASASMELIWLMIENGSLVAPVAEHLLAGLGPEEISSMAWNEVNVLSQVQASLLLSGAQLDVAHSARFTHLFEILVSSGLPLEKTTAQLIDQALPALGRADLISRWQAHQFPATTPVLSPTLTGFPSPAPPAPAAFDDSFDPYANSTDFKGSAVIGEELDKSYGRHSAHLSEALSKFKNMRRAGRHPRYLTYAKLITAAAKENRLSLAQEILAMAKQDVPLVTNSRVVRQGWVNILDSMVAACLTVGKRDQASQFHAELVNMGTAPSANTFGLYITTLKESTKTFDEATEAVKIFQRAKLEGVEPSSFLYNALIGKLGKARRIDDCLFYFAEMRNLGIRPTSVTYGTIVNALCRVSDDKFAEELFEEMESMPNYKPRPAPYNSLMQYFLTTKRDRSKVLAYYNRMKANKIQPTMHTYKLLIDAHASLTPVDLTSAEAVLQEIRQSGAQPEPVHYAALIHAKGCVLHDMVGARALFDEVMAQSAPTASLYQALFESYVANHDVASTEPLLASMAVPMTAYIANTLIHGWATTGDITKARAVYDRLGREHREPSTYEAMTRAYIATDNHGLAMSVVGEALRRGYPTAVANKICDLVVGGNGGATTQAAPIVV